MINPLKSLRKFIRSYRLRYEIQQLKSSLESHRQSPVSDAVHVVRQLVISPGKFGLAEVITLIGHLNERINHKENSAIYLKEEFGLRRLPKHDSFLVSQFNDSLLVYSIEFLETGEWSF